MSYFWMNNYYIFVIKCRRVENQARLVVYILGRMEKKWRGKEIYQGVWLGHGWICGRKIGGARVFSPQAHQNVSPQIGEKTRKKKSNTKMCCFLDHNALLCNVASQIEPQGQYSTFLPITCFSPLFSSIWDEKKSGS